MTANDKFFQEKQAAAVLKHGILERYPTVFTAKTGSKAEGGRVVYLDGFAGPGRYKPREGESEGAEGSPLLAVRTATTVEAFRRTLTCLFVERKRRHVKDLRETLAREAPPSMDYKVLDGDVSEHLDLVLDLAHKLPLLAFLDPFGTGLPYAEMTGRLLRRPMWPATEVLLNFNLQSVWRIGGLLAGDDIDASPASMLDDDWLPARGEKDSEQNAEASLARIDAFLGNDWWREVFRDARKESKSRGERAASARAAWQVANDYCDRIEKDTGYRAFTVPIRREPRHEPLFMMILFYRHPVAPFAFNEAVSKANEAWRKFTTERLLRRQAPTEEAVDLFGMSLPEQIADQNVRTETKLNQDWIDTIAANIAELITTRSQISVRDDTKTIFGTTLGLARETHLRHAWDQLAEQGLVRPRLTGKNKTGKSNKIEDQSIYRA